MFEKKSTSGSFVMMHSLPRASPVLPRSDFHDVRS